MQRERERNGGVGRGREIEITSETVAMDDLRSGENSH